MNFVNLNYKLSAGDIKSFYILENGDISILYVAGDGILKQKVLQKTTGGYKTISITSLPVTNGAYITNDKAIVAVKGNVVSLLNNKGD